jgi:hypothetical protein
MSAPFWAEVTRRMDEHGYMNGVERTVDRVRATGEVFTPTSLVVEMLSGVPLEHFASGRTVLDPACGDGQFLVAAKWVKILAHEMTEQEALADLYGIDIMRDNVDLCARRLGGGTIVMGNALDPFAALDGQTAGERTLMRALFADGPFDSRVKKLPFHSRKPRTVRRRLDATIPMGL